MKLALALIVIAGFYLFSTIQQVWSDSPHEILQYRKKRSLGEQIKTGTCQCAAFETERPSRKGPIMSKATLKVLCNEEGKDHCKELCRVLALATRYVVDIELCKILGHVDKLQPFFFARVCKMNPYIFTGYTSQKKYCCNEGNPLICKEERQSYYDYEETNATTFRYKPVGH